MRVYILIDPAQGYEESSLTVGVYGTYQEAEAAEAENRKAAEEELADNDDEWDYHEARRLAVIELWEGPKRLKTWATTWPIVVEGKAQYKWEAGA